MMDGMNTDMIGQGSVSTSSVTHGRKTEGQPASSRDLVALEKACKDFESMFLYTLLKTMRQSLPKTDGIGRNRDMYTSLGDLELARSIAHGRGIGLGEMLFDQLRTRME